MALCGAIWAAAAPARADTRELRWNPPVDATLVSAGTAAWLASEVLKPLLAPRTCRWCGANALDEGARDALVWRESASADLVSNVMGFVGMPLATLGLDAVAARRDGVAANTLAADTTIILEAAVLAADLNQLTKFLVGRERPFVHALPEAHKALTMRPADNDLSFYSGHATFAFALATAAGTVASMRGYRWAPVVWGAGGTFAAATAYLRIAADKHWLTDVLVGALVGSAVGFAVPFALHGPNGEAVAVTGGAAAPTAAPGTVSFLVHW